MLTTSDKFCYESAPVAVVLGAAEGFTSHAVASWDPLSVTLKYTAGAGSMSAPVVYGMAYATGLHDGVTPKISLPVGLGTVNGMSTGSAQGARFELSLANGQKWILYASESVSVTWSGNALTFASPLKGWVRLALQTTAVSAAVLDQHANAIPTGGALRLSAMGDTGVVEFSWTKQGTGDILAFALPHQLEHLAKPNLVTNGFASVRGQIRSVSGDLWQLQYLLSAAPTAVDPAHRDAIVAALNGEKDVQPNASDSYSFGKQVGRAAQLLLIAEALGEKASADQLRTAVESSLGQWLDGGAPDAALYGDATGDKNLLNLGRIMRATEAASAQRYYHIRKNSDIYPAPYNAKATTGVPWSDKAEFATFFSGGDAQIIGIQLLPFTMASEELIDALGRRRVACHASRRRRRQLGRPHGHGPRHGRQSLRLDHPHRHERRRWWQQQNQHAVLGRDAAVT